MADELMTIEPAVLEHVTGGRYTQGPETIDPKLIAAMGELAKAVSAVGQGLAQAQQQTSGQWMQMLQQMMQARGGPKR